MRNCIIILFGIIGISLDSSCYGGPYKNEEFQFNVETPDNAPLCKAQPGERNHGLDIFLDHGSSSCRELMTRPFIGIYADYNAEFSPNASEESRLQCSYLGQDVSDAPVDLSFGSYQSASCRVDHSDEWVDIFVVTQSGKWPAGGGNDNPTPYFNYKALLHTTRGRLREDLLQFRNILGSFILEGHK